MIRFTVVVVALCVVLSGCVGGSSKAILPPVGDVVYCPHCDTNLYLRCQGTTLTAFRRADYFPLFFDVALPEPGEEMLCPRCAKIMVDYHYTADDDHVVVDKVYYRRFVEKEEGRITEIQTERMQGAGVPTGDVIQ